MKSLIGKLGMLALLATAAGAVGVGCSSTNTPGSGHQTGSEGPQGQVTLGLVPVSGVTLNSVHYVVTNSATPPVSVSAGDLPTPGNAKDFSFGLSLPVGTGYTISLSAVSAENTAVTCAGASAPFNVVANATSNFTLTLTCHDNTNGQIIGGVDVQTDACPKIVFDYAVATPASANIGSTIGVLAKAHDLDGKVVSYSWKLATPAVGSFSPTTGATSTLTCNAPGLGTIVTVTANNGECTKDLTTTVSCKSITCGNGVLDPGETCDTMLPSTGPCPSDCTYVCGDGNAEAPAEDCDPGSDTNPVCDKTCHFRPIVCGDGFIQTGEVCDGATLPPGTPAGTVCAADCKSLIGPVCGDGIINGTEQCDDKGPSPTCSNTCTKISTTACVACENAGDCFESVNNCLGPVASPFTAAQQTQCFTVQSCIQKTNCDDGTGTLGKCYCGSLSTSACGSAPFTGAGAPDGLCVKEIQAGFPGITSNSAILGGLTATGKPGGAAMQRLNCEKTANSSACLDTCGFTAGGPAFP